VSVAKHREAAARAPRLWQFRGIGTALVGRLDHPDVAPGCYRQFAVTVFYMPIWFGRFYAVKTDYRAGGMRFAGPLTGGEIVGRYGRTAYWRFKLGVIAFPLIALSACAALIARSAWIHAHQAG
jgi:hypothetical protein